MRNCLIILVIVTIARTSFAQGGFLNSVNPNLESGQIASNVKSLEFWSSTFDNPADWLINHDAGACDLDWTIGTTECAGLFPIEAIRSTSKNDGWAMIDSDLYGLTSNGSDVEDSWISMATPVDLTAYPNVIVEFETHYRRFNYEQPYLVVGFGDGTGASSVIWPDLEPDTDISGMTNVFSLFEDFNDNEVSDNSQVIRVNISNALVGLGATELQNVYIRLHWTGSWGYAWFVDDFRIFEQPTNDIQLTDAWIRGTANDDIQYSIFPVAQVDTAWMIGVETYNFGVNTQTNIAYGVTYPFFTTSDFSATLESDSVMLFEQQFDGLLPAGLSSGDYGVTSNEESSGVEFGNNNLNRKVLVMNASQQIYAQDGIGIHDPSMEKTSVLGTNSLIVDAPSTADGMILATQYKIHSATEVSGLRVLLGEGSTVGGELYASIIDSTKFLAGNSTPLFNSYVHYISPADLSNGYIDVYFDGAYSLNPGVYFAAVKLYSTSNGGDVMILDDLTLSQPGWASGALFPDNALNSAGNCLAIRMLIGSDWEAGLEEHDLSQLKIYPNPTNGLVYFSNPQQDEVIIRLVNMEGRVIFETNSSTNAAFDFSMFQRGMYLLQMDNGQTNSSERLILD